MLPHARFLSRSRRSGLRAAVALALGWLLGARGALAQVPPGPTAVPTRPPVTLTPPPFTVTAPPLTQTPPPPTLRPTIAPSLAPTFLPTLPPGTLPPLTPPPGVTTMPPTSDPGGSTPVPAPSSALVLGSSLAAGVAWLWGRGIRDNLRALIERPAGRETR